MLLQVAKNLSIWAGLGALPKPPKEFEALYTWRAIIAMNIVGELTISSMSMAIRYVVFMNEASRYAVVVKRPSKEQCLADMLFDTLRDALLADNVNPEVIERYIAECGQANYCRNQGTKETAWLKRAVLVTFKAIHKRSESRSESQALTMSTSSIVVSRFKEAASEGRCRPDKMLYVLLERYGLPIKKGQAFDLKVTLDLGNRNDAVRKLRVSANITFEQLHCILQKAFCWNDTHPYSFGMFNLLRWGANFTKPDVKLVGDEISVKIDPDAKLSANIKLSDYLPKYEKILYRYDDSSNWRHYIELVGVIDDCPDELPMLLSGKGDAPPEDIGSARNFEIFLSIIGDKLNKDHQVMKFFERKQKWEPFDFEKAQEKVKNSLRL
jgi:hypothetical protein